MRILHVVYSLVPGQYRGGVPKAVYELAKAQADLNHAVTVYTTNFNSDRKFTLTDQNRLRESEGVTICYFKAFRMGVLFSPALHNSLEKNVGQFDVIHAHSIFHPLNQYVDGVARQAKIPVYYSIHGSLDPRVLDKGATKRLKKKLYLKWFEIPALKRSSGLIALSENEKKQISRLVGSVPVYILPNGTTLPALPEKVRFRGIKLVFVGRIHPKKGLHHLLSILAQVVRTIPEVKLLIGGEFTQYPSYTQKLNEIIKLNDLEEHVTWLGFLTESEKLDLLLQADIFCHFSQSEGMALAILEGMSAGLATVISRECYMQEAARAGAVMECDPTDHARTADLLAVLAQDEKRKRELGQKAREYVTKHHAWPSIAKTSLNIYKSAKKPV